MNAIKTANELAGLLLPVFPYMLLLMCFGRKRWRSVLGYGALCCPLLLFFAIYVPYYIQGYNNTVTILGRDTAWGIPTLPIIGVVTYVYTMNEYAWGLCFVSLLSALAGRFSNTLWVKIVLITGMCLLFAHYLVHVNSFHAAFILLE